MKLKLKLMTTPVYRTFHANIYGNRTLKPVVPLDRPPAKLPNSFISDCVCRRQPCHDRGRTPSQHSQLAVGSDAAPYHEGGGQHQQPQQCSDQVIEDLARR